MYGFQGRGKQYLCNCCLNSLAASVTTDIYGSQKMEGFILFDDHISQKPLCFLDSSFPSFQELQTFQQSFSSTLILLIVRYADQKRQTLRNMLKVRTCLFFPDLEQSIYKSKFHIFQTGFCR